MTPLGPKIVQEIFHGEGYAQPVRQWRGTEYVCATCSNKVIQQDVGSSVVVGGALDVPDYTVRR